MSGIRLIDIRKEIFEDNDESAAEIRQYLRSRHVPMINVMGSPGCGKTSFLVSTINATRGDLRIAVIEGDCDSMVDSEKITEHGSTAIQINTGGCCHLDAEVVQAALKDFPAQDYDVIFVENIGNLVCPAEFDIGESLKLMILSVPEGDEKILKYPLMFSKADILIVNKTDYLPDDGFIVERLRKRATIINPGMKIFEISIKNRPWYRIVD